MEFELAVKIILTVIMVFFFALRFRFTKHSKKQTYKVLIKYAITAVLLVCYFWGIFDVATIPISHVVRVAVGLFIILGGLALFFWAHIHLGNNWSPVIERKFAKSRRLVTSGPYHYVRHPIYGTSFIVLLGIFIFTANWLIGGIPAVILGLFYAHKIPLEEAELTRNFSSVYVSYTKKTCSLIPGVY